jgi:RNA polymerase sigma-70 factor, ECF subfamily
VTTAKRSECGVSEPEPAACAPAPPPELRELFDLHADFVYRVLLRLGVPRTDAEDCVQDVFLVVAHRLTDYVERGAIRAWLFVIARQVAMHAQRSHRRRVRHQLEIVPALGADDPHRQLERKRAIDLVHEFLGELDEPQAQAFYLAEVEQLTVPEVAAALDVKLNTVYSRLRLARRRLALWLAARTKETP